MSHDSRATTSEPPQRCRNLQYSVGSTRRKEPEDGSGRATLRIYNYSDKIQMINIINRKKGDFQTFFFRYLDSLDYPRTNATS